MIRGARPRGRDWNGDLRRSRRGPTPTFSSVLGTSTPAGSGVDPVGGQPLNQTDSVGTSMPGPGERGRTLCLKDQPVYCIETTTYRDLRRSCRRAVLLAALIPASLPTC